MVEGRERSCRCRSRIPSRPCRSPPRRSGFPPPPPAPIRRTRPSSRTKRRATSSGSRSSPSWKGTSRSRASIHCCAGTSPSSTGPAVERPRSHQHFQAALRARNPWAPQLLQQLKTPRPRGPAPPKASRMSACSAVRVRRAAGLGRHQPARQQLVGLGAQLHRLCDFRNVVAAPRHGLDRAATAVGLVRGADRSKRREQIAKPAAEGSLRARDRGARHRQSPVGRDRPGGVLVVAVP